MLEMSGAKNGTIANNEGDTTRNTAMFSKMVGVVGTNQLAVDGCSVYWFDMVGFGS